MGLFFFSLKMFVTIPSRMGGARLSDLQSSCSELCILAHSIPKCAMNTEKRCEGPNPKISCIVFHRRSWLEVGRWEGTRK